LSEKLIIRNFGPIVNVELDLKKFNVIIGEQATGKSTIAKVLSVCRYFSFVEQVEDSFENGLISWGISRDYVREGSHIEYDCTHYHFTASWTDKTRDLEGPHEPSFPPDEEGSYLFSCKVSCIAKSEEYKNLIEEFNSVKVRKEEFTVGHQHYVWDVPINFYANKVSKVLNNPFYLPTERGLQSLFSLGKSSIQNISDSLFNQLANLDSIARNFTSETKIEPLKLYYFNRDGKGFVRKEDESAFYALNNGASGYQSTIPIVLANKYYNEVKRKNKTFLIEEPELNLFPIAQKELVNYLVSDSANFGNQILLTTHSPYILTSLSNLMYAYEVGKLHADEVDKIIPKKYWLNPNDVACYLLEKGEEKTILDDEDGLILADYIDNVSVDLNNEFLRINEVKLQHELEHN
jgi:AAA15 family ATPase/GTPase